MVWAAGTAGAATATGAAAAGAAAPADIPSTSARTMRPFGPEPATPARLIPLSAAIRLANGEAITRSPLASMGALTCAGAVTGAAATAATGAALATGAASSPSPESVAITVPTFTSSVPSATSMDRITPSSTASNSMVALSVSISAMMSPDETVSPTFTSQRANLPCSMVGERAGILMAIDMSGFLPFDEQVYGKRSGQIAGRGQDACNKYVCRDTIDDTKV